MYQSFAQNSSPPQSDRHRDNKMIMKTVNDKLFDVTLISKFNKNDYKKTKLCRDKLKLPLEKVSNSDLVNFDFNWTAAFKFSIF